MMNSYFVVPCPGCKLRASVALKNLGKQVSCLRCDARFVAQDPSATSAAIDDPMRYWIDFTDRNDRAEASDFDSLRVYRPPR
jgi:hypothetical protein